MPYKTLKKLFFSQGSEERVTYSFGNNMYNLYKRVKEPLGEDLVSVLRETDLYETHHEFQLLIVCKYYGVMGYPTTHPGICFRYS